MNTHHLKKDQLKIIDFFHTLRQPLLIYGDPGTGKTTLALELLKDTILLRIDTILLKNNKDIKEYITDALQKRNVTIMFSEKRESRGLLLDDIHIYYKYDKSSYKSMIEFIKDKKYYNSKIILTCDRTFLKNKELIRLKLNQFELNYTYSSYYKICITILKDKNITISSKYRDELIYKSKYNFHKFISELKLFNNRRSIIENDTFDSIEIVTHKLLTNKYSLTDIIRYSEMEETIIGLNLLENSISFLRKEYYIDILMMIYDNYVNSDIIETYMISNHLWELRGYVIMLTIYSLNYYINRYRINRDNEFIYNRYISKSLAAINSRSKLNNNEFLYHSIIYYLIHNWSTTPTDKNNKYMIKLLKDNPREVDKYKKIYEDMYNCKINFRKLL